MATWDRALQDFISELEERVARTRQVSSDLQTSVRAYNKALEVANGASAKAIAELINQHTEKMEKQDLKAFELSCELKGARAALDAALAAVSRKQEGLSARRLSKAWTEILRFIEAGGDSGRNLDEIQLFIGKKELLIKETAVRSQLSIYSNPDKGYVEPMGAGTYRITGAGRAVLQANEDG